MRAPNAFKYSVFEASKSVSTKTLSSQALLSADCKRGRRKGATSKKVKNRQKCQKVFRHFSTIFAQGKKRQNSSQKASKSFSTLFDNFRGAPFFRPLLGGSDITAIKEVWLNMNQKSSRRLELSISKNTPHGRWGQCPGSVDPRFPAGLPFPASEILELQSPRPPTEVPNARH